MILRRSQYVNKGVVRLRAGFYNGATMDIHPLVVHFPIALLPLGAVLDLYALWRGGRFWHQYAYTTIVAGVLFAMVAVLTGNAAAADHWEKSEVSGVLSTHEDWATGTLLCGLLVVLGRLPLQLKGDAGQRRWALWTAGSVAAGVLVLATAYYGGVLVYEYGVGVQVGG